MTTPLESGDPAIFEIIRREVKTFDRYRDVYVGYKTLADYHGIPISADATTLSQRTGKAPLDHALGDGRADPRPRRQGGRRGDGVPRRQPRAPDAPCSRALQADG